MKKKIIATDRAPAAVGPYSQGVLAGHTLYVSGQIPINPATGTIASGIESATRQCLENGLAVVTAAGGQLEDIVKVNIFLTDMGQFDEVNSIYAAFFGEHKPARACVEVSRLPKDVNIEIEMVAVIS